jgi:predicted small metal-binding protein
MRKMTCRQLGGACDFEFQADTFEEVAELSKKHGLEMFHKNDKSHLESMSKMQELMQTSDAMNLWMENKRKEFEALPNDPEACIKQL